MTVETTAPPRSSASVLIVPALIGCAVSAAIGAYAGAHHPAGVAVNVAGFGSPATVKVWLTTAAVVLAIVQLLSALVMYGKLKVPDATYVPALHRWSGRAAFLLTIPVAMHCVYALGFQTIDARVLLHSIMGTMFFGAFTVKMLVLTRKNTPGWALPVLGGVVFTLLALLFVSSSIWFFANFGVSR
jgi:hypothetical protein